MHTDKTNWNKQTLERIEYIFSFNVVTATCCIKQALCVYVLRAVSRLYQVDMELMRASIMSFSIFIFFIKPKCIIKQVRVIIKDGGYTFGNDNVSAKLGLQQS